MRKPYTTKLPANGCVLGTVLWIDHDDPKWAPGYTEVVTSYRQRWGRKGFRGTYVNGRLHLPGSQLEMVIGAGTKR